MWYIFTRRDVSSSNNTGHDPTLNRIKMFYEMNKKKENKKLHDNNNNNHKKNCNHVNGKVMLSIFFYRTKLLNF